MINLEKISGLPIELTNDFRIKFNPPLEQREPSYIRDRSEVVSVLKDPSAKVETTYWGYRQIYLPAHKNIVEREHLQYDLTIIPPQMLGEEFNKTVGHYHANIPGTNLAHPELYEILHGHALIILQKADENYDKISDVLVVEAKAGDRISYPPNYGHILVNIGSEVLVTANWLSTDYKPLYEPVKAKRGMAYYVIQSADKGYELVANQNYGAVPGIRSTSITPNDKPMYSEGMVHPKMLEFLNHPEIMYN